MFGTHFDLRNDKIQRTMKRDLLIVIVSTILSAGIAYFVTDRLNKKSSEVGEFKEELIQSSNNKKPHIDRAPVNINGTNFSDAAERGVASVVYVKVTKRAKMQAPNSMFDLLFGFVATPKDKVGIGSGVITSEDGYIVTNNHVISGADEVEVTLYDNSVYPAKIIGTDPATDIALLKIEAPNLAAINLGDSDNLRLGEWVLAIGSPYDLRSTITAGIVSAKGRQLPNYDGQYRVESFIQTDAAVNPGNSGGALINTNGELVGINTSIISLTGSYTGYSFAVPVNIVKSITDDFIKYGKVQRAVLGISMIDTEYGVYIAEVAPNSPAANAGLRKGDFIREINLNKIKRASDVQSQVGRLRTGEKAIITINRDKSNKEILVQF
jgi:S1-C subfamily serine protease